MKDWELNISLIVQFIHRNTLLTNFKMLSSGWVGNGAGRGSCSVYVSIFFFL